MQAWLRYPCEMSKMSVASCGAVFDVFENEVTDRIELGRQEYGGEGKGKTKAQSAASQVVRALLLVVFCSIPRIPFTNVSNKIQPFS